MAVRNVLVLSVLALIAVLLLATSGSHAIQLGKARIREKKSLAAELPSDGADAAVPKNIVEEKADTLAAKTTATPASRHNAKTGSAKTSTSPKPKPQSRVSDAAKAAKLKPKSNAHTTPKNAAKTGEKLPHVPIYLRTDGLPAYAAKAKELLAAAEGQSWPGEPLVQGCTPLECQQWCAECGTTATCENRCFLYSQCNDEC